VSARVAVESKQFDRRTRTGHRVLKVPIRRRPERQNEYFCGAMMGSLEIPYALARTKFSATSKRFSFEDRFCD
jgi:hypothetical protein